VEHIPEEKGKVGAEYNSYNKILTSEWQSTKYGRPMCSMTWRQ